MRHQQSIGWSVISMFVTALIACSIVIFAMTRKAERIREENAQLKEAIGKIYLSSIPVRVSFDLCFWEVAKVKWNTKLKPSIDDAVKFTKRTKSELIWKKED